MTEVSLYLRLAILLMFLSACAHLAMHNDGLPLRPGAFELELPDNQEMQAVVGVSRDGVREDYLLAVSTRSGEFSCALLTPQGIPVYSVKLRDGRMRVSQQAGAGEFLKPAELLRYLELVYLAEHKIKGRLRDHWKWNTGKDKRNFYYGDSSNTRGGVHIDYAGNAPWYSSVVLKVPDHSHVFSLRILETSIVVPE